MMKNYGLSNLTSFCLACGVYFIVVGFVFFRLVTMQEPVLSYTDIKDSFINVDLSEASTQISSPKPTPKPQTSPVDVNDLFAKTTNKMVKTQNVNQKATDFNALFGNVKEIQEEKSTQIQSSKKSGQGTNSQSAAELLKQLNDNLIPEESTANGQSTQAQKVGIYDEFLGKVERVIKQRWSQYYPNPKNIGVKVKIFIDSEGKFGYTSVEKSYDSIFDAKVLEFLESQKGKFIAYPPKNKGVAITMNLKDEGVNPLQ
ncbi:energy transducer TonB [Campylobacter upsaliensis]|uniref:Periplasmic protein TonB n=3 Tax=Campylobacter upsaliensis TaxID=28080 RepID=A0A3S4SPH7_CAMUP|nr:energy transducer TonB [Campylobacter upsaliensis]EAH7072651.1 energy transducer TonB [Campylobacter upsaliensis]EAH7596623.1 energy transducer TonB [Campylobacter upsaliensis]EAH8208486.1 energy transducer TonB [Campylobacter upsaliensis]EAH8539701.1 energy transducer TonB [Campylobacter upsaliensis]